MSYQKALEAAGAKVIDFKEFGSYQGDWFAFLDDGQIVSGSYGSCSGCDAYQAEFGYSDEPEERGGKYFKGWGKEITKVEYDKLITEYQTKLSNFGQSYLTSKESLEEITARYKIKSEDEYSWGDDKEIYEWF